MSAAQALVDLALPISSFALQLHPFVTWMPEPLAPGVPHRPGLATGHRQNTKAERDGVVKLERN